MKTFRNTLGNCLSLRRWENLTQAVGVAVDPLRRSRRLRSSLHNDWTRAHFTEELEARIQLTTVVVNSPLPVLFPAGSLISLENAVATANISPTPTTITFDATVFASPQTITLTALGFELTNTTEPTTIVGPAATLTIDGGGYGTSDSGIFTIDSGVVASLSGLTLTNSGGAGIYNAGTLNLSNTILSNNTYGGLNNVGTATLTQDMIDDQTGNAGNGIGNQGTITLSLVTISTNAAGGIGNSGNATITDCTIDNNGGGGISNTGTAALVGVTISNNTAPSGGGIYNDAYQESPPGGGGTGGTPGPLITGTMSLVNVTISGNMADSSEPYEGGQGGGIFNIGALTLVNTTVSNNVATSSTLDQATGGGIYEGPLSYSTASLTIVNSIVAGNTVSASASTALGPDVYGTVTSEGFNLIGETDGSSGWNAGDLTGTIATPLSADLSSLGDNGGPTETMVPMAGSPAIDHGFNAFIPSGITTDQRGYPRIYNGTVDIGAVEVQPTPKPLLLTAPSNQTAVAGKPNAFAIGSFVEFDGPYTADVHWGDGTADTQVETSVAGTLPNTPHTYASTGTFSPTVIVTDSEGHTSNPITFSVVVSAPPPATGVTLDVGSTDTSTFTSNGQADLYQIAVASGEPLSLTLTDAVTPDHTELFARFGSQPTLETYDYADDGPGSSHSLLIPHATEGSWYVLVYGESVTVGDPYAIAAATAGVVLSSVSPMKSGTSVATTLTLIGAGFDSGTTVSLVNGTLVYDAPPAGTEIDSSTRLTATFGAGDIPAGTYAVQVTQSNGTTAQIPGLTMDPGGEANLITNVIVPNPIGNHIASTIYVQYSNAGDISMPAPILVLSASRPNPTGNGMVQGAFMTLDPSLITSGFWSNTTPVGYGSSVEILASGASAGVLEPGELITVPVYYAGWLQSQWNFSNTSIYFQLSVIKNTDSTSVDWASLQSNLQPVGVSTAAWSAIYPNLESQLGTTSGGYVQLLDNEATYLGQLGENITDVNTLWGFAVQQADAGDSPVGQTLTSAIDDTLPTPGPALSFNRSFGETINSRYILGPLGYGWSTPWQTSLSVGSDGTVTVLNGGGGHELFQPDSRTAGAYFSQPGDTNTLSGDGSGGYFLTATDGDLTHFLSSGLLDYVADTNGNKITAGYNGSDQLTSLTASSGQALTIAYNAASRISSVTDSFGRQTTYNYDASNQYLTSVTTPQGTTQYAYNAINALTTISFADGTHEYFTYDSQGRLASTSQDNGADAVSYTYNVGQVTSTDSVGDTSSIFFNELGLVSKTVDGLGNVTTYAYDPSTLQVSQITDPVGDTEEFAYDSHGNLLSTTDQLGNITTFTYGADSRLTSLTNANSAKTSYAYDGSGNLLSTTYPDQSTESSTFNPLGEPISFVDRGDEAISYGYNTNGQLTSESFPDGTSYTYIYDSHGNLQTATDATGTTTFSYNAADELIEVVYPNGTYLKFTLDAAGRRLQMVDQTGFTTNYQYDAAGHLSGLTDGSGNPIVTYTYNAASELTMKVNGNGTYTTYTYDADGNVLTLVNYAPGGAVNSSFNYTYNSLGLETGETTEDGTWTYTYDADGQLIHAVFASTNPLVPNQDLAYNYDALGNRTSTVINGVTTDYTVNNLNEYTSVGGVTYTYDADGNLLSDGANTYTYNVLNQLTGITPTGGSDTTFTYNALGQQVASTAGGQTTENLIDPTGLGNLIGTFTGSGSTIAEYTYGLGLTSQVSGGSSYYYDFDSLGSTVGLSNSSGAYLDAYNYQPFGAILSSTIAFANPFQFAGHGGVIAVVNGLSDMRARYFSSFTGRFISEDPLGLAGGDINLYRYVWNTSVQFIDPTGLFGDEETGIIHEKEFGGGGGGTGEGGVGGEGSGAGSYGMYGAGGESNYGGRFPSNYDILEHTIENQPSPEPLPSPSPEPSPAEPGPLPPPSSPASPDSSAGGDGDNGNSPQPGPVPVPNSPNEPGTPDNPSPSPSPMSTTTTNTTTTSVSSHDPNSLTGPAGYGSQGFIGANEVLPYRIDFENDPTATAPAQAVTITDPLSTDLDWSTFQLTGIGWGDFNLTIPAGSQTYETTVPMTYNGTTFDVQVQAGIHAGTGQVYATFQSIDPATSLPPSVLIGLLPPEDGTGRGQGYITYLVSTKTGLATGTSFNNVAVISFDQQTTIATDQTNDTDPTVDPTKEATLTIDAAPPTSSVDALPAMTLTPTFTVSWSGQDDAGGSGIASYDIYVSIDGGAFQPWLTATTATSAAYPGTIGHSYGFYSVARDNAGNVEALPSTAQAQISVPAPNRFVTFGGKVKGQYTDANGHIVTFILSGPGSGTLGFVGSDPSDPVEIILTGTTARSSLTVEIAKGAVTTLTDVQISGSLNIFNASTSDLEGSFEVGGTLRSLTLKDVISGGATISVGGSAVATVYHFGSIDGLSLTSASAIRLLTATTWFDSGSSTDSLTAHSVLAMQIKGNFDPILNLTGALGSLAVNGSIVAGTWIIAGHIGAVKVGSIANGWSATVAGSVGPFIVKGTDNGSVTAASIASMQIGGSSTDAAITVTGSNQGRKASLGSLVVDGSLTDSQVRTFGGIGAITLGGMSGSDIFAGISSSTTTLPTALAEFVEPSSILSFTVKGKSPFADSIVAASMIGTMNLADVNTNNNGSSFGVATESLGSFSLRQPKQKAFIWNNKQSASLLTSLPGDLKVEEV